MPTENLTVYWCQDCGLRCDTIAVPFIAATHEQPEEGGYFESACCGGEVQEEPYHTCDGCGDEIETMAERRDPCRLCKAKSDRDKIINELDLSYMDWSTSKHYYNFLDSIYGFIHNFKRKELTR